MYRCINLHFNMTMNVFVRALASNLIHAFALLRSILLYIIRSIHHVLVVHIQGLLN